MLLNLARGKVVPRLSLFVCFCFSFCHLMEFGFFATIASGLLSWGHFIFNSIIDLTALTLFNEN